MNTLEKLRKANDNYHEAFNDVLKDEELDVKVKAKFGNFGCTIFTMMTAADKLIEEFYEG